ncbi:cytochrome c-type biogenesis protein [Photobacterium rosenbergii]|uniref:Cytochrome c-type biogenesis protein n=1 Tax=Photobacterium rosenbergii TaxID=294936 RepID=A0ABU3ZLV0_9GAMM|nr:cytochrome c-type biogenesis protein [Photobacterium rosenbergii]MDV5171090.1 cytochrome c-type biogenesis protein [Photobacterium rosenbergii]
MMLGGTALLATSIPALAFTDVYDFESAQQEKDFQELTATLRCPKCQNNNIADSNAALALDMRQKTYELLQEGKSKQDVVDYMIARYGNFVTYNPPVMASTLILWLGPLFFIVAGFTVLVMRSRKGNEKVTDTTLEVDEQARLKALMSEIGSEMSAENGSEASKSTQQTNQDGKVK